ncbi:uncharacterized protein LOC143350019 isoform X2 [Colletes latitarsis]|uniref:uncharacterized protein LOC143350019 isoform X2 n=1 Tax=Colletes latitarsis TaxID=2605962 RepID=UPI0040373DAE
MQRVLSFQMARGLDESSEFVTKRMCFSFLFSIGFVCVLCGFLLGRFSTQRIVESHAENKRLEFAGNGLESTRYLQHLLLQRLEGAKLDADFEQNCASLNFTEDIVDRVHGILSNFSLIDRVVVHPTCIFANARGYREPDRYVVVSASGEGVCIVLELAKIMNDIQREHDWKPRRSLIFCFIFGSSDSCSEILFQNAFVHSRIMAYVVVHHRVFQEAASIVKNLHFHNDRSISSNNASSNNTISRLALDIPHAVLSFVNNGITIDENDHERNMRKIILAQILGQTIWKLSECLIMKWNPRYFDETVSKALDSIDSTKFFTNKGTYFGYFENSVLSILNKNIFFLCLDEIQETSVRLLIEVKIFNGMIDAIDTTNVIRTRILNDLMMDLDRTLLCSDRKFVSKTDWAEILKLAHEPFNVISTRLKQVLKCYETAVQLLQNKI